MSRREPTWKRRQREREEAIYHWEHKQPLAEIVFGVGHVDDD